MSYNGETTFYKIPYITDGEYLSENNEKEQLQIIDNLLYLNNYFYPNSIISEGIYSLEEDEKNINNCILKISPNPYSFIIIFNKRLYYSKKDISLTLHKGKKYYIYFDVKFDNNNNDYDLIIEDGKVTYDAVLLCIVDLKDNKINLDNKSFKLYLHNFKQHLNEKNNPHGKILNQDTINVNNLNINGYSILKTQYLNIDIKNKIYKKNIDNIEFINVMPIDNIGNFRVLIEENYFTIFSERDGKCKLELRMK